MVFFDAPVRRTVPLMLTPSQSARTMADRLAVLSLFIMTIMLTLKCFVKHYGHFKLSQTTLPGTGSYGPGYGQRGLSVKF